MNNSDPFDLAYRARKRVRNVRKVRILFHIICKPLPEGKIEIPKNEKFSFYINFISIFVNRFKFPRMKAFIALLISTLFPFFFLDAQIKKNVEVAKITTPVRIDGILSPEEYMNAIPAKDFVQLQPYNGSPSMQKSEVWFQYDQDAVYIGAMLYDTSPDSIYNFLTERDDLGSADYFGVYMDPYNQGLLSYGFFITPSGVQMDMKAIKNEQDIEDETWDAVWESAATINEKGWSVEMRIPYSALRIPDVTEHTWGMNMFRRIRRYNSNNSWNQVSREVDGFIDQQGTMTGIRDIQPPVRLSLSPYAATYFELKGDPAKADFIYKGGMDLKYGLNESFTLDMMLVPDFGQIQSDDKELNLSPYELFYDEKRQFFTEGTEMFGRGGLFYSRRIGAAPKFANRAEDALNTNEVVDYNPSETQLLNATKISGRTAGGWGLGFLNAMTLPSNARLKDTIAGTSREILVQPFTNYNVSVVDRSLKNNSYFSLINTNVAMAGDPFLANTTAFDFQLKNKNKTYAVNSRGGVSYRNDNEKETGYGVGLGLQRIKGKFMFDITQSFINDKLNINDLGYMRRNNEVLTNVELNYNITQPFGIFKEVHFDSEWQMLRVYNPWDRVGSEWSNSAMAMFTNNYVGGVSLGIHTKRNDYYETHVDGRYFVMPGFIFITGYAQTDSRKKLFGDTEFTLYNQTEHEGYGSMMEADLNLRLGQRFRLSYDVNAENFIRDFGFADVSENEDTIYFAKRNVHSFENVMGLSYVINNKMGINLRVRHYWSGAENLIYYQLQQDGSIIEDPGFDRDLNQNYNAFSVDMRFRWIFAPGSELTLAWKNTIYDDNNFYRRDYFGNLSDTWNLGQTNSISLKILYYIDYNQLGLNRKG